MKITRKYVQDCLKASKSCNHDRNPIVADITRLLERYQSEGKRPLYVYCNATGSKCGMTAKSYFESKVEQYGSIDKLFFNYKGKRGKAAAKPKMVKGREIKPAPERPHYNMCNYTIATDKKGNQVFRTEIHEFDPNVITKMRQTVRDNYAGELIIVRDFDEKTGETKYIKGSRDIFNKTHTYVRVADRPSKTKSKNQKAA